MCSKFIWWPPFKRHGRERAHILMSPPISTSYAFLNMFGHLWFNKFNVVTPMMFEQAAKRTCFCQCMARKRKSYCFLELPLLHRKTLQVWRLPLTDICSAEVENSIMADLMWHHDQLFPHGAPWQWVSEGTSANGTNLYVSRTLAMPSR